MKVLLVNPTRVGNDSYCNPPLHLMYLKSALDTMPGCVCEIMNINYEVNKRLDMTINLMDDATIARKRKLEDEYIARISGAEFDILGIGGIVPSYEFSERLVETVASKKPQSWIIVGGGLGLPLKDLWHRTRVGFIVEGDAETTIVELVKSFPHKHLAEGIGGVYSRKGTGWSGVPPVLSRDLDYIAYPSWEGIDTDFFIDVQTRWVKKSLPRSFDEIMTGARLLPVVMTRGCPYECTFCFHFNRSHRKHSVDYVISYLESLKMRFGITMIQTWDDLVMADKKWFCNLCDALKKKDLKIKIFMTGGKPNLVDNEMLGKMKEAGVIRISYGVESGSPRILSEMKKGCTTEQNFNAVALSVSNGIFTHMNIVLGMPGETPATIKETKKFLMGLQRVGVSSDNLSFSFATAYPGTTLFSYAVKNGFVKDVRKYVTQENRGVGDYSIDYCGLGERRLKRYADEILISMDMNELRHNFRLQRAVKLLFFRIPKFILKACLPKRMLLILKKF